MQLTDKIWTKINDFYKGKHTRKKKKGKKKGKQATTTKLMFRYFKSTLQLYL